MDRSGTPVQDRKNTTDSGRINKKTGFISKMESVFYVIIGNKRGIKMNVPEKKYDAAALYEYFHTPEGIRLLEIATEKIGKKINTKELFTLYYISNSLQFNVEQIETLMDFCKERAKLTFPYMEAVAVQWYEAGRIPQKEDGENSVDPEKYYLQIMKELGKRTFPAEIEKKFMDKWLLEYAFPIEIILEACDRAVLKTDSDRFPYTDGILTKWHEAGLKTISEIEKSEEKYRESQTKKEEAPAKKTVKNNAQKSKYDFAALQKWIDENP